MDKNDYRSSPSLKAAGSRFGGREATTHSPVMELPENYSVFDFTSGYDPEKLTEFVNNGGWGVGGYNEKRGNMYVAPQYENRRNIHMGIDIWAPAGAPVFAVLDGEIAYTDNHDQEGNYGPTIVLRHVFEGESLYALYGHLSLKSLEKSKPGKKFLAGDTIGWLGNESENGNWPPHLHFQLGREDPGEADMPGVVSEKMRKITVQKHPDPRIILGKIY